MEQHLSNVLPFLSARLKTPIAALSAQPITEVMNLFGEHAILFLQEIAADHGRVHSMTLEERNALQAIKEVAALVGIHG